MVAVPERLACRVCGRQRVSRPRQGRPTTYSPWRAHSPDLRPVTSSLPSARCVVWPSACRHSGRRAQDDRIRRGDRNVARRLPVPGEDRLGPVAARPGRRDGRNGRSAMAPHAHRIEAQGALAACVPLELVVMQSDPVAEVASDRAVHLRIGVPMSVCTSAAVKARL